MKPHYKPTTADLAVNSIEKRLPFYTQGVSHLANTKHGKAYQDYGYPLHLDFWFYYSMYRRRHAIRRSLCGTNRARG